jgi:hypothetical protein
VRYIPIAVVVVLSFVLTGAMHGCVPTSKRLVSPIVCPSGTETSVVVRYMKRGNNGKTSDTSDLVCIDGDGGGVKAGDTTTFLVGYGFTAVGLTVLSLPLLLGLRRRRRGDATP